MRGKQAQTIGGVFLVLQWCGMIHQRHLFTRRTFPILPIFLNRNEK